MPVTTIRGRAINWVDEHYPGFWDKAERSLWEPHTYAALDRHVTAETIVIDIGAHIGAITLFAAQCAARVIAIEPDPVSRRSLLRNLAANPAAAARVEVVAKAVHPRGTVTLGSTCGGGDSMSSVFARHPSTTWEVETITPAELSVQLPAAAPVFVKIDIEGAEYDVVTAASALWQRPQLVALVSTHPQIVRAAQPQASIRRLTASMFQALAGYDRVPLGGLGVRLACLLESPALPWSVKPIEPRDWLFTRSFT